ncbi:MAG: hypothetical protein K5857_06825 [Lachnospiraceae bacterium]|nr:hypothetical protein [Lachnospiraceae bacterium]
MNKEAGSYIKNVMKGRDFVIDFINAALAAGILIMVVLNSIGIGRGLYFVQIFAFGALLTLFNCIKKIRAGSGFAVAFGLLTVLLATVAVLCYFRM